MLPIFCQPLINTLRTARKITRSWRLNMADRSRVVSFLRTRYVETPYSLVWPHPGPWLVRDRPLECLLRSQEHDPAIYDPTVFISHSKGKAFVHLATACTRQEVTSAIWIRDGRCCVASVLSEIKKYLTCSPMS
jgi:hypothetical protein